MTLPPDIRHAVRRLEITSRRQLAGVFDGGYLSRLRGSGMEFAALRPYEPGDDVRHIDWNATARTGAPQIRLHRPERTRAITLLADYSASCTPAKRNLMLQTAALMAFAASRHGDPMAVAGFSDRLELLVPFGRGDRHSRRILGEMLACRPAGRRTDLEIALRTALNLNRRRGMVILLCDLHAPLPRDLLRRTVHRHDLLALILRDSGEAAPPLTGPTLFRDAESGEVRLVDLSSSGSRRHVEEAWRGTDLRLTGDCSRLGIDAVILDSDTPPILPLQTLFRRRRRA